MRKLEAGRLPNELHRHFNEQLSAMGAFLNGRVTYELMAQFWPTADTNPSSIKPMAAQRVGSSEQGEAGSAAAEHPAELGLPVTQEETHRHFPRRVRRKRLPTAEQILAPHQAQVGGRLVPTRRVQLLAVIHWRESTTDSLSG